MIAFKLENLWKRSNRKIGSAPISNAPFAPNHTSLIVKTAEVATTPSNRLEDENPLPTNPSSHRTLSNNTSDLPTQSSPLDIKHSRKDPTILDTLDPNDNTHSRTSYPMLQQDPLIKHPAIKPSL